MTYICVGFSPNICELKLVPYRGVEKYHRGIISESTRSSPFMLLAQSK